MNLFDSLTIDFYCEECGHDMKLDFVMTQDSIKAEIAKCENCKSDERRIGYDEGHKGGHYEGFNEGYERCKRDMEANSKS